MTDLHKLFSSDDVQTDINLDRKHFVTNNDVGFFSKGDTIPKEWISADSSYLFTGVFGVDVEISFKKGWLNIHATQPLAKGDPILDYQVKYHISPLELIVQYDIRLFDHEGKMLLQLCHSLDHDSTLLPTKR